MKIKFFSALAILAGLIALVVYVFNTNPGNLQDSASDNKKQETKAGGPILGVFEGITPCDGKQPPLPQIPVGINCEMMIWRLTLNQDPDSGMPTSYSLESSYGMSQPNTLGIIGGGTRMDMNGNWNIITGVEGKPDAVIYQLNQDGFAPSVLFLKVNHSLLHVLSQDKKLRVGNGGWSYTLNRTDVVLPPAGDFVAYDPTPLPKTSLFGVFEGRTPCQDLAQQFNRPAGVDCVRIKWRLTLHQDPTTFMPTRYKIESVVVGVGDDSVGAVEGDWKVTRTGQGVETYQLHLTDPDLILSLAKGDDNTLFFLDTNMDLRTGNSHWSYTLSRVR